MPQIDSALKDWLDALASAATFLGIPIAILVFWFEQRRERFERQAQIYLSPNNQYIEYLKLCFEHPELDIYDLVSPGASTPRDVKREWIAFNILVSVMEQAFLLYRGHPDPANKQWTGWCDYMRWWLSRSNFRRAWDLELSSQFDSDFIQFMNSLPPYNASPTERSDAWMHEGLATGQATSEVVPEGQERTPISSPK
ncbi:MAG: hypothetical protein ABJC13_03500 [Acidobacteriota bacterium]